MALPRVLAIHDISCVGKCSLTVALPIISACGAECAVLPTAVLSTHTGGFTGYTFKDLTDEIDPIFDHWQSLGIKFDAVYSGYLGSYAQLEIVGRIFDRLRDQFGAVIIVDPVMADNGALYPSFPADFPQGMRKLCEKADIIIPNMTEASLMLGIPYNEGPYSEEYINEVLTKLSAITRKYAVVTGDYGDDPSKLGAAYIDCGSGETGRVFSEKIDGSFHGTGDVFGSAFTGAVAVGKSVREALQIAADFTSESVRLKIGDGTEARYGVPFESALPLLIDSLKQ